MKFLIFFFLLSPFVYGQKEDLRLQKELGVASVEEKLSPGTITLKLPGKEVELYSLVEGDELISFPGKKKIQFDKSKKKLKKDQVVSFSSLYVGKEIIKRYQDKLSQKRVQNTTNLLNSKKKKDFLKLLLGEKGDAIESQAGLIELKRRYENIDEDLHLMMNGELTNPDFAKKSYIPTGFIEIEVEKGQRAFIPIEAIKAKKIDINIKEAKANILDDLVIYFINEMKEEDLGNKDLNSLDQFSADFECTQGCSLSNEEFYGDFIESMIDIQIHPDYGVSAKVKALRDVYRNLCSNFKEGEQIVAMGPAVEKKNLHVALDQGDRDKLKTLKELYSMFEGDEGVLNYVHLKSLAIDEGMDNIGLNLYLHAVGGSGKTNGLSADTFSSWLVDGIPLGNEIVYMGQSYYVYEGQLYNKRRHYLLAQEAVKNKMPRAEWITFNQFSQDKGHLSAKDIYKKFKEKKSSNQ